MEEFATCVLEGMVAAGGDRWAHGNEVVAGEEAGEGAGIEIPEVKGMGEVGPLEAVEGEAHGVAVGHGKVELAAGAEEAGGFAEFEIGIGHVFEAVTEDDGVKGGVGELEIGDESDTDVDAVAPSRLRGAGTGIDSQDVAAALAEVDEDVAVTRADFEDARRAGTVEGEIDVEGPPGDGGGQRGDDPAPAAETRGPAVGVAEEIPDPLQVGRAGASLERIVSLGESVVVAEGDRGGAGVEAAEPAGGTLPEVGDAGWGVGLGNGKDGRAVVFAAEGAGALFPVHAHPATVEGPAGAMKSNRPTMGGVTMLVHGGAGSVEVQRAQELARGLPAGEVTVLPREGGRWATAVTWWRALREGRPGLVYVINTAMPGGWLVPWWARRTGGRYVLDTGDAVYEMARSSGIGAGWRLPLLRWIEGRVQGRATAIVVRGTHHRKWLLGQGYRRVELIRDGYVDRGPIGSDVLERVRRRLALPDGFVVGVLGSTVYSPRLGICYGWDLIGALARMRDEPGVTGLIVGDGDGLPWLRREARRLGVEDRVRFAGRIPYEAVQPTVRLFDVALSTQTNNLAGRVRTTGKLPEYMAAGRFIVASRVGEAPLLLPEPMLLDFEGAVDRGYPERLAARIREVRERQDWRGLARMLPERAREACGYDVLRERFAALVRSLMGGDGGAGRGEAA